MSNITDDREIESDDDAEAMTAAEVLHKLEEVAKSYIIARTFRSYTLISCCVVYPRSPPRQNAPMIIR